MSKKLKSALLAIPAFAAATGAHAAAVDVTGVVSDIAAQAGPIGLIGSAVLLIIVAVAAFKWVRGALR
ncbi:major capsid protein [Comamonas sp. Y6]|uniref:Major capsid protein n=1 Tax=Comamonas resistens TaxID=3046670 RepID=A0ABY8SMX7_9BURK|nr:major capsid protein [Comamonas resistens]MDL5037526.1 major capsid protein [Comamonas resistens]WHS64432.1 major capsid protein [Comamonas resistens]